MSLISGAVASLPLLSQKRDSNGAYVPYDNDSVLTLLAVEPNPRLSSYEFWRLAARRMLLEGGAFLIPRKVGGVIVSFDQVRPRKVSYNRAKGEYIVNDPCRGYNSTVIPESDILFFRGSTDDGECGISVAAVASSSFRLTRAGDAETLNRMENSGLPMFMLTEEAGVLGTGTKVEGARKDMMKGLESTIRRFARAVFFPRGIKAQPIVSTSVDMQLQSMREFAVRDICRFFGVPPIYAYSDATSNYKSTEAASVDFMVNTLSPMLNNIESELRRKLIPREQWGWRRYYFDRSAYNAADSASRANYLSKLAGFGVTVNELRGLLGLAPVDGGDEPMISANVRPINDLNNA